MRIDWPIASCGGVAEHAFGRLVPGRDDAVQILADDRVVGRFDDPGEMANGDIIRIVIHASTRRVVWKDSRVTEVITFPDFRCGSSPPGNLWGPMRRPLTRAVGAQSMPRFGVRRVDWLGFR